MIRTLFPISAASIRFLVFDLDGTLIDSRRDLVESVNATLRQFDLPPQHDDRIASYIGNGAAKLIERALAADGADPALAPAALEAFLAYYRDHSLDHTLPYPGVVEQLATLRERLGVPMAVLTNKPVGASQTICDGLGLSSLFVRIYGGNSFATKKPHPEGLQTLMREAGVSPEQTVMIGDSSVDILTAQAAGTRSIGCRFGLSPRSIAQMEQERLVDAVVDSAHEWSEALGLSGEGNQQ